MNIYVHALLLVQKVQKYVLCYSCVGSVSVYNLQLKTPNPIYQSTANTGKHTDPVWQVLIMCECNFSIKYVFIQVAWQKNDSDNNLNFYSTSSDGRIVCWTIVKVIFINFAVYKINWIFMLLQNELQYQDMTVLKMPGEVVTGPEGIQTTAVGN